jgi:Fur family zinc uptake transcriptional regulator
MRRHVLEVLSASHKPLGAYEIIDLVAARGPRPAPITIYRALDFLTAQGLVHRIESRNAFLACINNHASDAPGGVPDLRALRRGRRGARPPRSPRV